MFINDIFGDNKKKLDEVSNELIKKIKPKKANEDAIDDRFAAQYNTPQALAKSRALDQLAASGTQADYDRLGVMSPQQIERDYQAMRAKEPEQDAAVYRNPALTPSARSMSTFKTNPKGVPIKEIADTGNLQETFAVGDQPQIDSITKGDEQYWADFDKRAVAQGDARQRLKSTYVDPVDKTIQPTIGRTWQERGVKLDKWSKETYKHQPEFYQDLDKINAQLASGQKITDPNLMKLMPSYREVQQTNPKGVPIGKKATYEQSGANTKETEPTTNQPRTSAPDERKAQLRKDIDAVDYNKQQQPSATPSAEQKAGIRQAVTDYNKEKVKEQGSERSPYPPEKDFPNWYDMRDRKFEVHRNDGTIDFIQPGTDEWNEIYDREFPDHPRPDNLRDVYSDGNPVAEAGPFSYGAKKPRKGSVTDLAAKKRKEQEKGRQPAEPRDQMVGVAKVVKEFAPSGGGGGRWYSDDQLYEIIGEDWLEAFDVSGDQGNIDLRGERARLFLAQEAEAWLTDRGYRVNVLDVRDDGDELSWYIQGPLYRGLDEDWKKVNRRDRTPGMSRKAVKAYRRENPGSKLQTAVTTKPSKLKKGSKSAKRRKSFCARMKGMKRAHAGAKTKRNPDSPINKALRRWNCESVEEMRDLVMIAEQRISAMREGGFDIPEIPRAPQPRPEPKNKAVGEGSVQDKLHRRHQELRKKSGLPDPNYYKELKATYDLPDEERYAKAAELKKKYQVKEARKAEANFDVEDLKRLEQIRDLPTLKAQAMALISKPSERPMKPEKVAWFDAALDRMDNRMAIIKLMYDLLLSGEGHQVIGSKRSMNPNSYRSRFGESTITNEDVEKYVEELERAGYEIVNERRMTCPECGGPAYADQMLAEKQDACYHKVKSRYKVWPSAYASGALVRCRKKGAKNWGNKSKK